MINPAIKESSVDFPQPEGPAIEVKLPGRTEKETSFNAGVSPDEGPAGNTDGVWIHKAASNPFDIFYGKIGHTVSNAIANRAKNRYTI